jgi:hypothetical protein
LQLCINAAQYIFLAIWLLWMEGKLFLFPLELSRLLFIICDVPILISTIYIEAGFSLLYLSSADTLGTPSTSSVFRFLQFPQYVHLFHSVEMWTSSDSLCFGCLSPFCCLHSVILQCLFWRLPRINFWDLSTWRSSVYWRPRHLECTVSAENVGCPTFKCRTASTLLINTGDTGKYHYMHRLKQGGGRGQARTTSDERVGSLLFLGQMVGGTLFE